MTEDREREGDKDDWAYDKIEAMTNEVETKGNINFFIRINEKDDANLNFIKIRYFSRKFIPK